MALAANRKILEMNSELFKALTATSASGQALQPEDLEPELVNELLRLQPLLQMLAIKQARGRVHEIARRTARGRSAWEGEMVDNRSGAVQSTYDRPTVTLKVLHHWGSVSGFQRAAAARFIDSLVAEQQAGLESMANQFEFAMLWGDSADPYNPDGFDKYITTNIIDHNAVASLTLLDDMIDAATGFRGVDRDPAIFIASKKMVSKISGLQNLARIQVQNVEFDGGLRMTSYRNYPILETDYVKPAGTSPAGLAAAAAAGGSLPDGTYRYRVAAVYESGEQVAAASVNATAGAGNNTINLTWTADPEALLYKIFRSDVGGGVGTEYLYTVIAGVTRDAEGKITGSVTSFSDNANLTRPAGAANERPLDTGDENIFFINLNPERGAALLSLVNAAGDRVDNLINYIELAKTRDSYDFMYTSFAALQVPWQQLHAHARRVSIS